jgi:hypothetical protein
VVALVVTLIASVGCTPSGVTTEALMPVYPYQLANGSTRWFFIIDLPASTEGRRRQRKKARLHLGGGGSQGRR